MAILDIIVTHWKEQWSDGRKMFEMLKLQRGLDWKDVRVLLVQDGEEDNTLDMERIMKVYPFVETVMYIPHTGVSAARNEGLRQADAEWVMFCDFDDLFYSVDSLALIITAIEQAGDRADILWSDFWIEMETDRGRWAKVLKGRNAVFIHGKCYRRTFLLEHNIWFDENLSYSEDALFNAICEMEADPKRIAKILDPVYMWCHRHGSASNYDGGDPSRNRDQYYKRLKVFSEYAARGMTYDARASAARMLLDYYWEINGRDELPGHPKEEWIRMLQEDVIRPYPNVLMEISADDRARLYQITKKEAKAKRNIRENMIPAEEWLREIGAVR